MDAVDDPLYTVGINLCWVSTFPSLSALISAFGRQHTYSHASLLKGGEKEKKTFSKSFKKKTFFLKKKTNQIYHRCPIEGHTPLLYILLVARMPKLDLWACPGIPKHLLSLLLEFYRQNDNTSFVKNVLSEDLKQSSNQQTKNLRITHVWTPACSWKKYLA